MKDGNFIEGLHRLVVNDDVHIADLVSNAISAESYCAGHVFNAAEVKHPVESERLNLLVLDLILPSENRLTFRRKQRGHDIGTPIIVLTAKGDDIDRVLGSN